MRHYFELLLRVYHFLLAFVGAVFYGFPSRKIKVIGITGTKGKTTSVELLHAVLNGAGHKTAALSSVHIKIGDETKKNMTGNSMPGRFFIQKFLRDAVRAGCEYAVIEVTSQGVLYHRHRFVRFAVAAITNIAPEHIEAHGSFEQYREEKAKFLRYAAGMDARVFINHEDQGCEYFFQDLPAERTQMYATESLRNFSESSFVGLPGIFNRENVALVAAIARYCGVSDSDIEKSLKNFKGVPGRMEYVQREPFAVVCDYAHTPDSLRAVYGAMRQEARGKGQGVGRLICVLGAAGGGRDKWKRPLMGQIAGEMCDEVILTDEDPYGEIPENIIEDIFSGISKSNIKAQISKIVDRKEAIEKAISLARPGDTVVMTGKGSETSIHIAGGKTIRWNEKEVAETVLGFSHPTPPTEM